MSTLLLLRHATRPFESLSALEAARAEAAGRRLLVEDARLATVGDGLESVLHAAAGPKTAQRDEAAARARLAILAVKRAVHNRRTLGDDEVGAARPGLTAPVLGALEDYSHALASRAAAASSWEEAFLAELQRGRRALVETTRDPLVSFGIALAGRPLLEKLRSLEAADPAAWAHGERHVAAKALAYIARFATKTSPNAVFCATALARAEADAASATGRPEIDRLDVILSVAEARKVAAVLAADPAAEPAVVPRPNATMREAGGSLVYWKFASLRHATDDESLTRVKDHPVARAVLEESRASVPLPELRRRVAARCGVDEQALGPFLREILASGLLIGEIEIPYNERRPLRFVALGARAAGCDAPWIDPALAVEDAVDELGEIPESRREAAMARIESALSALPHTRPLKPDELFRVDAASGLDVTLPASVFASLHEGLTPYMRLFATLYPARRYLQAWVARYLDKFPPDRDVELLDVYRVMTEAPERYRPAAFPEPAAGAAADADPAVRALKAVRAHLAAAALHARAGESIPFDDAVLDGLVPVNPRPRWACGIVFQVAARDLDAVARGEYLLALNGIFHGAGLSLSRFAHLLGGASPDGSNPIVRELRRAWSIVDRPGAIVAELTYNHTARTANAGLRPAIFEHEIELPGDRASPGARVHGLRDLTVRFDTGEDRFVLRLAPDGPEVIPVINSGVSPAGFVSFLVAIGEQALQPIGYFPGFDEPGVTHWPRVVAGKLVLFREHWVFRRGEWPVPSARADDLVGFARSLLAWRARWGLPRHAFVHSSEDPKPRYVDLASPLFVDQLRRDLVGLTRADDPTLHVTEMFPGPGDLFIRGEGGGYASEFLVQTHGGPVGFTP